MDTCVTKDRGTLVRTVVKAVSLAGMCGVLNMGLREWLFHIPGGP